MNIHARNPIEAYVEPFISDLVSRKNAGEYVDIPINENQWLPLHNAIGFITNRMIRVPLGNVNGTYGMSDAVNRGNVRITLKKDMPK